MPHTFKLQKIGQAEDHLNDLVYFRFEEHHSAQYLLQVREQGDFDCNRIVPKDGINKSANAKTYSEFTDAEYELWL